MGYILDTNICIYIIKRKPVRVFEKFRQLELGSVGISSITLAELQYGVNKSAQKDKNQMALNQFVIPLEILHFDEKAAIEYGKVRANLEKKGTPIWSLDFLIAAHAKSSDQILVTNNEQEFNRVDDLIIENWIIE